MQVLGIVGAGTMGTDIAHIAAEAGFEVLLYDKDDTHSRNAFNTIQERLNHYVRDGRMDQDGVSHITTKIKLHQDIRELAGADIILESITENLAVKKQVFRELDAIAKADAVLATNTSSISISAIASATKRPESVIGIHFLIPARVMGMVEIISGLSTTRETFQMTKDFVKKLGKKYVEAKDFPGFVVNRMVIPMINEAAFLFYENAASPENIDKLMTLGLKQPMGPLALADLIGLDVVLAVMEEMHRGYGDSKYRPCPLLKQYVNAGWLGQKTGRGFYIY